MTGDDRHAQADAGLLDDTRRSEELGLMPTKKLFLSSTCYDLAETRVRIEAWARRRGYEPVLSDRANFPIDPNVHRHDVCLANAKRVDMFVLLVASRFGAPYYADSSISVTWAEFRAAAAAGVPIVVFVDKRVWDERNELRSQPEKEPVFTQDKRTFAFLSEVQGHPRGYWMQIFGAPDTIIECLDSIATLFPITLHKRESGVEVEGQRIVAASLSAETQHHVRLVVGDVKYLRGEDLQEAMLEIPDTSEQRPWARMELHGFSVLVEQLAPASEEQYQVRPTPLGEAILEELRFAFALV